MYQNYIKRPIDFCLSLLALPFVTLTIVVMGPIIYLSNPGPIFYMGERRGLNGVPFKMMKFRSMYVNSPDIRNEDGSTFNSNDDPRVTKIGKFMRKTSIDEIPQLLNVLKGDMSFVGPRPTLATKSFDEVEVERRKRYDVRPGITGYAQAYFRNSIPQKERFKCDLYYVDNISFWFDVKILAKTFISVLRRENINMTESQETVDKKVE